jgi:hypothetical protein
MITIVYYIPPTTNHQYQKHDVTLEKVRHSPKGWISRGNTSGKPMDFKE